MGKKLLFIMLFILLSFNCINAQTTEWLHSWGGNKEEAITSLALDQNGNLIAAGYTNSFGFGTTNVLLQKYDNSGNLLWTTTWGGSVGDAASSVATDKNNNIYIVGSTSSFGSGWYDVLILKFDSNGSLIWSKTWGGSSYDAGYGISIDSNDNLIISAESYSFGTSAVLLKFDNNGNYLWGKSWKSTVSYDAAYSLTIDLSGNIILTGISWDYSYSPNVNKISIIKYDKNGNLLWCRNWGGSGVDEAWGSHVIKTDNSGNIYIAGRTQFGSGGADALLLKLDANGELIWSKNWGGKDYDTNNGIDLDNQGNIYTVGYTKSFTNNQSNLFLLKYDTSGNLFSSKIWNNNHDSQGQSILINQNNIYMTGISYNSSGSWNDVNGTTGNPNGSLSTPSNSVSPLTDVSKNINGQMTNPTGTVDSGGGSSDALIMSLSTFTQNSFLSFPLKDFTPYNAPIVSVFDHSGNRYCPNDTIVDFIGEVANVRDLYEPPARSNCGYLYSYKKNDGSNFLSQIANYVGTRGTGATTLNYDGHPGYDFRVDTGTAVYASADGKVIIAHDKDDSGSGKYIRILHDNGYVTQYLHLNEVNVVVGQSIKMGDIIGYSGNTGGVSPHLHFEVKEIVGMDTISVDPYGWLGNGADPYTLFTGVVNYNLWLNSSPNNNTTDTKILETGDDLIHGFKYYNGFLWASTRTSPARILKIDPSTLEYQKIILPTGYNNGEDLVVADGNIYVILSTDPARIIQIEPNTMTWRSFVQFSNNELNKGQALTYTTGILWAGGFDRSVAKIDIQNGSYQIFKYQDLLSNSSFHALTSDNDFIWGIVRHYDFSGASYASSVIKIDPTNPSNYSSQYVDDPIADDIATVNGSLYCGTEKTPSKMYKFSSNLVPSFVQTNYKDCFGIFYSSSSIWSVHVGSPGQVIKYDLNLYKKEVFNLPDGFLDANEIAFDPIGNAYVTCWEKPAKIVKLNLTTGVDQISGVMPSDYFLFQNYPNPFNPTTVIRYSIPRLSKVTLKIYDILGKEVEKLVDEEKSPGQYEVKFNAKGLASGVYFYRMQAGSFSDTKKFILIK
ncbi:MAG: peptidoglycan DD-metalloendopeptidase family protein [Bacteroidetes bacterium]|nr:peptidoglycan DD-metalloendopeptidase family protein [Bacteroidota bacterium]